MKKAIKSCGDDHVATALTEINPGENASILLTDMKIVETISPLQRITFGNKIALVKICTGDLINKGGHPIGVAIKDIKKGDLVHVQNVRSSHIDIPEEIIKDIIRQMEIREDI